MVICQISAHILPSATWNRMYQSAAPCVKTPERILLVILTLKVLPSEVVFKPTLYFDINQNDGDKLRICFTTFSLFPWAHFIDFIYTNCYFVSLLHSILSM